MNKKKWTVHHITACIWFGRFDAISFQRNVKSTSPKFRKKQLNFERNFCETSDTRKTLKVKKIKKTHNENFVFGLNAYGKPSPDSDLYLCIVTDLGSKRKMPLLLITNISIILLICL